MEKYAMEKIHQVVIERCQPNDDGLEWNWEAFGEKDLLVGGWHKTLEACVEDLRSFLADEAAWWGPTKS